MGGTVDPFAPQTGVPSPYGAMPAVPDAPAPEPGPASLPTSAWLTLPGAAGQQIAVYDLDRSKPYVVIDGVRAKRDLNANVLIPMAAGGTKKLKIRALFPGYATVTFGGRTVYTAGRPPLAYSVSLVVFLVGVLILCIGTFALPGVLTGVLAYYGAITWVRKARNKIVPYIALGLAGVVFAATGVALLMLVLG